MFADFFRKHAGAWATVILMSALTFAFYSENILHPNKYLFSAEGDGIKNYYTYVYHIHRDTSYSAFRGMNYPYGDLTVYTDGSILVAETVRWLGQYAHFFPDNAVGILNLLMLISFIFSAYLLYKILRIFDVSAVISVFAALGITILNPQVFRLTGHFGLSFGFVLPLIFLLTLKRHRSDRPLRYAIVLFIVVFLLWFIHPYLAVISIGFLLLYDFCEWYLARTQLKKRVLFLSLYTILPLLLFRIIVASLETHSQRPATPGGFYEYMTTFSNIFLPFDGPFAWMLAKVVAIPPRLFEDWSYVGAFATFLFLIVVFKGVKKRWKARKIGLKDVLARPENRLLFVGVILLFYAFGLPYIAGFKFLLDLVPMLKQIRVLGRFAWVFFFAVNIFAVVRFYRYLLGQSWITSRKWLLSSILIACSLLTFSEGYWYHVETAKKMKVAKNIFRYPQEDKEFSELLTVVKSLHPENYQAIVAFPFYYIGAEELLIDNKKADLKNSMGLSYHLNKSLVNTCLSRTSVVEAKKIIQSFGLPCVEKMYFRDLKNRQPFLLICRKTDLREEESLICERARLLGQTKAYRIYELTIDAWKKNLAQHEIENFKEIRSDLVQVGEFFVRDSSDLILFESFESVGTPCENVVSGERSYRAEKTGYAIIYDVKPRQLKVNQEYEIQFWHSNIGTNGLENMWIFLQSNTDGTETWLVSPDARNTFNFSGNWALESATFTPSAGSDYFRLQTKNLDDDGNEFFIDDLLIRKKGSTVYRVNNGILYLNNFPLGKL